MPQILNYIRPDENPLTKNQKNNNKKSNLSNLVNGVDFGLLNVYTCSKICNFSKNTTYLEEHITRHFPSKKSTVYEADGNVTDGTESERSVVDSDEESEFEGTDSGSSDDDHFEDSEED